MRLGHDRPAARACKLPAFEIFGGELVAFDSAGQPDFPLVHERMPMRRRHVNVVYVIFDLLSLEGVSLMRAPYSERRAQLESLDLNGSYWRTPEALDNGSALIRSYWRYELERESAINKRRPRIFV
jgi:bifunctional non-homologous end joining protein LigD